MMQFHEAFTRVMQRLAGVHLEGDTHELEEPLLGRPVGLPDIPAGDPCAIQRLYKICPQILQGAASETAKHVAAFLPLYEDIRNLRGCLQVSRCRHLTTRFLLPAM